MGIKEQQSQDSKTVSFEDTLEKRLTVLGPALLLSDHFPVVRPFNVPCIKWLTGWHVKLQAIARCCVTLNASLSRPSTCVERSAMLSDLPRATYPLQ